MISYKPLRRTLVERDMKKMDLKEAIGISNSTLSKFDKNEMVAMSVIEKICLVLKCKIEEVVEILPDNEV